MGNHVLVAEHYTTGDLLKSSCAGVEKIGKSPEKVDIEDLAPVDEFHIGAGRRHGRYFTN